MVTDSLAFCANPAKLGMVSLGLDAAQDTPGASSTISSVNVNFDMAKFLCRNLNTGLFLVHRRGLTVGRLVRQVQFLAGDAQRLQPFAPSLESTLLQALLLQ